MHPISGDIVKTVRRWMIVKFYEAVRIDGKLLGHIPQVKWRNLTIRKNETLMARLRLRNFFEEAKKC